MSIHISFSSDPFILRDSDTVGTRDGKRINGPASWHSEGAGNETAGGVELKKEQGERSFELPDTD